jgi:hypothetical protein
VYEYVIWVGSILFLRVPAWFSSGPRHAMVSTFYNDLYAFDLDRRRWYKLGLKQKKAKLTTEERRAERKLKRGAEPGAAGGEDDDQSEMSDADSEGSEAEGDETDSDDAATGKKTGGVDAVRAEKGDFFGYIDETGNVVYINLNDPDPDEAETSGEAMAVADDAQVQHTTAGLQGLSVTAGGGATVFDSTLSQAATSGATDAAAEERRTQETARNQLKYQNRAAKTTASAAEGVGAEASDATADGDATMQVDGTAPLPTATTAPRSGVKADVTGGTAEPQSAIARYFAALTEPCPRINPAILTR